MGSSSAVSKFIFFLSFEQEKLKAVAAGEVFAKVASRRFIFFLSL